MPDRRGRALAILGVVVVTASLGLGGAASWKMTMAAPPAESGPSGAPTEAMVAATLNGRLQPPPASWTRTLDENFTSELDPTRWGRCFWWGHGGCTIVTNDELEWYQPDNVTVADGRLRLEAQEEAVTSPDGDEYPYTSGMVSSGPRRYEGRARTAFTYGYVEARLRLPQGQGLWPAFWLLPADSESRPEVDILETLGQTPDRARFHYHYWDAQHRRRSLGGGWSDPSLADGGWHRFAVDWRPGSLTWIVDGRARWRVTGSSVPREPLYIVLNLAVGGVYPGPPDGTTVFPAAVEADWIRVWQAPPTS